MNNFSSATGPDVRIQLPTWLRVYAVIFGVVWFGMLAVMVFLAAADDPVFAIMPIFMGIFGGIIISRMFRIGVRSTDDGLLVRNFFSSRTFHRSEIEGFRQGQLISPLHLVIFMTTPDKIHPLHVTMHTPFFGKRRAQDQLQELRTWLGD